MHELSIAEGIIEILERQIKSIRDKALSTNTGRVKAIKLKIGEMSGVVPDALKFSFEIASKGTIAEGAELYIEHVPLTAFCSDCSESFHIKGYCFECSRCGGTNFKVITGRELLIEEIEVEDTIPLTPL